MLSKLVLICILLLGGYILVTISDLARTEIFETVSLIPSRVVVVINIIKGVK